MMYIFDVTLKHFHKDNIYPVFDDIKDFKLYVLADCFKDAQRVLLQCSSRMIEANTLLVMNTFEYFVDDDVLSNRFVPVRLESLDFVEHLNEYVFA